MQKFRATFLISSLFFRLVLKHVAAATGLLCKCFSRFFLSFFCKQKILRGIFSPQDLVFPSNYYFELAPNAPVNAASIAFKTFITTSITFIVCSFMCFCSIRFSVIRHALCGRARIQGVVVRSGIGIYLTASASRTGFLRFVRTAKLYVLVGQGKCRAHSRAFHKAYHYVRNIGFF